MFVTLFTTLAVQRTSAAVRNNNICVLRITTGLA